jgi:hypothetical protein
VDIPTIAQQLNVAHVLEGSVRKDGQKIRITAQLIDARTDTHLWSATYDRTLDDIFVIQDEIAGQVTESLKATLLGGTSPKSTETDPEAYALYLRGAHLKFFGTEEASKKAETYLREALAIDPEFAPAWGYLFSVLVNSARSGFIDYDEGHRQARAANSRHLELNPNSAEAHTDRAWLAMIRSPRPWAGSVWQSNSASAVCWPILSTRHIQQTWPLCMPIPVNSIEQKSYSIGLLN